MMRQMAHDMRGLLATVTLTSGMLLQGIYGELTPEQARASERIQRTSDRLVALLEDLMAYVKAEMNQYPLHAKPFDPRVFLDTLCQQTVPLAESKGLALKWTSADALPDQLSGDSTAISRIVMTMLWNAIGFTETGRVEILSSWSSDNLWTVTIRDSGSGITPEQQAHIFEPFYQGEKRAKVPSSGFGMGLAMASALARIMGGQLLLEKSSAEGSTFSLYLPLIPESAPDS